MKPSLAEFAAALIAVFEGERLKAYRDSGGVWTIGIGHTKDVHEGMVITHEEAIRFFAEDQSLILKILAGHPTIEAAALASFGFNCGRGALERVLLGADSVDLPRHAQDKRGNVLPGLVARRRLEKMLIELGKG